MLIAYPLLCRGREAKRRDRVKCSPGPAAVCHYGSVSPDAFILPRVYLRRLLGSFLKQIAVSRPAADRQASVIHRVVPELSPV